MPRRIRILARLSLSLLLVSGGLAISRHANAESRIGSDAEVTWQDQAARERGREIELVQEVLRQVWDNYLLAIDPVRLAAGAIEGMSSTTGENQVAAEQIGRAHV